MALSVSPTVTVDPVPRVVEAGTPFQVTGTATGASGPVTLSLDGSIVGTATPGPAGRWRARVIVDAPGDLSASVAGVQATPVPLAVAPAVGLRSRITGVVLSRKTIRARVAPTTLSTTARVRITPKRGDSFSTTAVVSGGRLTAKVPLRFFGRAGVSVTIPSAQGFRAITENANLKVRAPILNQGDRSKAVKPLLKKLRSLRFHIPGLGTRYTKAVSEVVLAFRKSQRMNRTYEMTRPAWRRLLAASPMRARYRWSGTHIEVDKTRQIMMVVRNGRVLGTLHVSTGATGNTPEGTYAIFQRGGSYLYRFMAFVGNFGIHGYVPVPTYPASHGCVREPMWAADWTWSKTTYGSRVVVYR